MKKTLRLGFIETNYQRQTNLHARCIWDLIEFALQILDRSCIACVRNISEIKKLFQLITSSRYK